MVTFVKLMMNSKLHARNETGTFVHSLCTTYITERKQRYHVTTGVEVFSYANSGRLITSSYVLLQRNEQLAGGFHICRNWNANLPCHHRLWHASEGFLKERQTDHMTLNLIESFLRPLAAGPKWESKQWASGAVDRHRIRPLLAWTMHVPLACLTKSNMHSPWSAMAYTITSTIYRHDISKQCVNFRRTVVLWSIRSMNGKPRKRSR